MHAILLYTLIGLSIKRASSFLTLQPITLTSTAPSRYYYDNIVSSIQISSTSTDSTTISSIDSTVTSTEENNIIRPLPQNWWPVSLLISLDKTKPNAIELLGKKLVLWYDIPKEEVS